MSDDKNGVMAAVTFTNSIIDAVKLQDDEQSNLMRERLFDGIKALEKADAKLAADTTAAAVKSAEVLLLSEQVAIAARGAAVLLAAAEPALAGDLPLGGLFADGDVGLIAERVVTVSHSKEVGDDGKAIGRVLKHLCHRSKTAEEESTTLQAEVGLSTIAIATRRLALMAMAREAELYVRLHAEKGSPASRQVKKRYVRNPTGAKGKAPAPAAQPTAHASTPLQVETVPSIVPSTAPAHANGSTGTQAPAAELVTRPVTG